MVQSELKTLTLAKLPTLMNIGEPTHPWDVGGDQRILISIWLWETDVGGTPVFPLEGKPVILHITRNGVDDPQVGVTDYMGSFTVEYPPAGGDAIPGSYEFWGEFAGDEFHEGCDEEEKLQLSSSYANLFAIPFSLLLLALGL